MRKITALSAALFTLALAAGWAITPARAADPKPDADGFVSIFDGKTLDGWEGNPELWSVQDGAIRGQTKTKMGAPNTFLIYKGGEPGDFELRLRFKLTAGNSGVQYRSKVIDPAKWVVGGYQADCDANNTYTGICYEERGRGILVKRGERLTVAEDGKKTVDGRTAEEKEIVAAIKKGDWNEYVITAKGPHVVQKINGVTTAEFTDNQKDKAAAKGVLALQLHAGDPMLVEFKDIRMKKLD